MSMNSIAPVFISTLACLSCLAAGESVSRMEDFKSPPKEFRPKLWWRFMDDYATREGIIADLDGMKDIGLGGAVVSYCSSNSGVSQPKPGSPFIPILSNDWWNLMDFKIKQAADRDLDLWFQVCPGYATSGGPWIKPENSMQKLVWSQTKCNGSAPLDTVLPLPKVDQKWNFYRDVAVLAYPEGKGSVIPEKVLDISRFMDGAGRLKWVPGNGLWKIVRFGHTTTGVPNHPVTPAGHGLECDKLSKEATRLQFENYFGKIKARQLSSTSAKVELFFDSWEAQNMNWTPGFREAFRELRGYDPLPWLLTTTGVTVGSEELSRRFDYDWKTTIEELINSEHFAELSRLSHERGASEFRAQPYNGPVNFMTAGALFDIPEGEYWLHKRAYGWWSLRMIASVAHVNGKKVAAAESLTAMPQNHHMDVDPFDTKAETDLAFTMGINSMAIHAAAHNPWPKLKPGMTSGFFPPLVGAWQSWNSLASSWVTYLSRCCYLLQQGDFSADVVRVFRPSEKGYDLIPGHASDLCNEELIVSQMIWDGTSLSLPGGMRYKLLELPDTTRVVMAQLSPSGIEKRTGKKPLKQNISLPLLKKVRELVLAGATVLGPRPIVSPGLTGYPECDREIEALTLELWGAADVVAVDRKVGKGRVFSGISTTEALAKMGIQPDFQTLEKTTEDDVPWIHRRIGNDDLYFVSNQKNKAVKVTGSFRVEGKIPEFWNTDTGDVEPVVKWNSRGGRTYVELDFAPRGSFFVRFRHDASPAVPTEKLKVHETIELSDNWIVRFAPGMGAPAEVAFPKLVSWTERPEKEICYFSGIATYQRKFAAPMKQSRVVLDLGNVKNLARVSINGIRFPELWKPPFTCDITSAVKPGMNMLSIEVANLWANRLVGDEQEPADVLWDEKRKSGGITPLQELPDWLIRQTSRPSPARHSFSTWNYIRKDQPLFPSGLLGPVLLSSMVPE